MTGRTGRTCVHPHHIYLLLKNAFWMYCVHRDHIGRFAGFLSSTVRPHCVRVRPLERESLWRGLCSEGPRLPGGLRRTGSPQRARRADSPRGQNRRMRGQHIDQARNTTNTGLSRTPAASISHCTQIETLPMACRPRRTNPGHIALGPVEEPLTGPLAVSHGKAQPTLPLSASHWRNCNGRFVARLLRPRLSRYVRMRRPLAGENPSDNASGGDADCGQPRFHQEVDQQLCRDYHQGRDDGAEQNESRDD
jgi:hypothetical protein